MTTRDVNPTATLQPIAATDTDEYSPYMGQIQWKAGTHEDEVVFELFARSLPRDYGYLVFGGLADSLEYLRHFHFSDEELAAMKEQPAIPGDPDSGLLYDEAYLEYLRHLRFTGSVYAPAEGTFVGAQVPLLRVVAPRIQGTIIEAALLATVNQATGVMTKATRITSIAGGKPVWEGGLRRIPGVGGGVATVRAAYIGGLAGGSAVRAYTQLGIPTNGTMAHAWIQQFGEDGEQRAFETWLSLSPKRAVLLIDTYDVARGIERAIAASKATGVRLMGVRIDSGDLAAHSRVVRKALDDAGFTYTTIMASGDLDEYTITELEANGAKYDKYLVGTKLVNPGPLGVVYKLTQQAVTDPDIHMVMKRAIGKQTDPGSHQAYQTAPGHQTIALQDELLHGRALLTRVMSLGEITGKQPSLEDLREYVAAQLADLPDECKAISQPTPITVSRSPKLWALRAALGDTQAIEYLDNQEKAESPIQTHITVIA